MTSPREFWLEIEKDGQTESTALVHFAEWKTNSEFFEVVHVIEIEAYNEVCMKMHAAHAEIERKNELIDAMAVKLSDSKDAPKE